MRAALKYDKARKLPFMKKLRQLLKTTVRRFAEGAMKTGCGRNLWLFRNLFPNIAIADYEILFGKRRDLKELKELLNEIQRDDINNEIEQRLSIFEEIKGVTKRGNVYGSGAIKKSQAHLIYAILRKKEPRTVVETGVCNGYSTAFILLALDRNKQGRLYSIDFPEVAGQEYEDGLFWHGKGGAVVPRDKESGWLVPKKLRGRWKLILGKSQEKLPSLIKKLKFVDVFFHDSEHSYVCQMFEFNQVWGKLTRGGLMFSHDITWNNAFFDFARKHNREPHYIDSQLGFLIK